MLSHYPFESSPEWYDAALDQWQYCICENCQCKNFQIVLAPPRSLCTCTLLNDGRLFAAGGCEYGKGMRLANIFDLKTNQWTCLTDMHFERIKPYIVQLGRKVFVVSILFY
jgi:kelch-like protein 2/3